MLIFHLVIMISKYCSTMFSEKWNLLNSVLVLIVATQVTMLCDDFTFSSDTRNSSPLSNEQAQFEAWLWIELITTFANLAIPCVFAAINFVERVKINLHSPVIKPDRGHRDFMDTQVWLTDYFVLMGAPTANAIFYSTTLSDSESDKMGGLCRLNIYLSVVQIFFFTISICVNRTHYDFLNHGNRNVWQNNICHYAGLTSFLLMPGAIIVANVVYFFLLEELFLFSPFMVFVIISQVAVFIIGFFYLQVAFIGTYERGQLLAKAYPAVNTALAYVGAQENNNNNDGFQNVNAP